jgi:hypothetical protein
MRAFILGAGSSVYAGFPLGKDLWDFLIDHCGLQMRAMETISNYLSTLDRAGREQATADLEFLLTNLEEGIIPSMPASGRAVVDDRHQRRAVKASLRHTLQNSPDFNFDSFWKAQRIRRESIVTMWSQAQLSSIRDLTYDFVSAFLLHHACIRFGRRHFLAGHEPWPSSLSQWKFSRACPCRQRTRISSIRRGFDAVSRTFRPGDTIITFNYDATVEASLWAARKWHFADGYGIAIDMTSTNMKPVLRGSRFRAPSPVKILKPHGSINWAKSNRDGHIGLNYLGLLFDLRAFSTYQPSIDLEDGTEDTYVENTLLAPTYLKDYSKNAILGGLWDQIDVALRTAAEITVVGYSLPAGDTAARLRMKAALRENTVCQAVGVVSPGDPALGSWAPFLDSVNLRLEWRARSMEAWLSTAQ